MAWNIPEETTHVSVNCMEDKDLVLAASSRSQSAAAKERNQAKLDRVELNLFNLILAFVACLTAIYVFSQWIVKPIVTRSSLQLDQSHGRATCCGCSSVDPCSCNTPTGRWISSHQISLDIDDDDDQDYDTHSSSHAVASIHHDFDMQIPADFDAVPIVTATILPILD